MKRNFLTLKSLLFILIITLLPGFGTHSRSASRPPSGDDGTAAFFSRRLSGGESQYNESVPIAVSAIERERESVWEAWKIANSGFEEEKLIDLQPLSLENSGRWKLPESLEPDAIMPFYWGSKGERPDRGYPLFLYLHGSGDKHNEWAAGIKLCNSFDDAPSVYFIPQIPNMGDYYRWYQKSKQFAWEKMLRLAFLTGDVDPDRVYVFGISEGGYGSQRLASFYADYLAGAGPMAGGEPLKNAPVENCRNIAFTLRTGAEDTGFGRNAMTRYTKEEFKRLQTESPGNFIHNIQLIPGRGHSIDYSHTTPWLGQYTRNPYPKRVTWENMEMDGRYRDGFYNIYVVERSNDDQSSRTYYDLVIDGNELTLAVQLVTYRTTETLPGGIEMKFEKSYTPAAKGKIIVYLCPELVDLDKEITLTVNGKKAFKGMVKPDRKHLVNSCAAFFDPARLYPAAVEVDLERL